MSETDKSYNVICARAVAHNEVFSVTTHPERGPIESCIIKTTLHGESSIPQHGFFTIALIRSDETETVVKRVRCTEVDSVIFLGRHPDIKGLKVYPMGVDAGINYTGWAFQDTTEYKAELARPRLSLID